VVQVQGAMMNKQDEVKLLRIFSVIIDTLDDYNHDIFNDKELGEIVGAQLKRAYNLGKASNEN